MATLFTGLLVRLKSWALMAGAVFAVLAGAYVAGGRAARKAEAVRQHAQREKAQRQINAVDEKLAQMDDDSIRRELARFVRDD